MKKIFAFLTAICCLSGIVSAIPVSAENFEEQEFYVVSRNSPDYYPDYFLHCYSKIIASYSSYAPIYQTEFIHMNREKASAVTIDATSDYQYGDILIINSLYGGYESDSSYPPRYYLSDMEELHYAGNCKEILESKELTLTKKEKKSWWGISEATESITFFFDDEAGNEYEYLEYYYTGEPEIDMNSCSVGDTVTFSVYQDTLILPLELHRSVITGDVDGNGRLDILDVIKINKAVLGKEELAEARIADADFNGNGMIDAEDSLTVMKMIVGLV